MHAHHIHLLVGDIAKEVYPLSPYRQYGFLLYGSRVVEVVYPCLSRTPLHALVTT